MKTLVLTALFSMGAFLNTSSTFCLAMVADRGKTVGSPELRRRAVIDIGSHGIKYLIADVIITKGVTRIEKIIRTGNHRAELARGMGDELLLTEAAMRRGLKALKEFREVFEQDEVDEVLVAATSAVRTARNRTEFCERAKKSLKGIPVWVLSQQEEGFFGFHGAVASFRELEDNRLKEKGPRLVIDIGGGSIEATLDGTLLSRFELGAVRFADQYLKGPFPLSEKTLIAIDATLQERLKPLVNKFSSEIGRRRSVSFVGIGEFKDAAKLVKNEKSLFEGGRRIIELEKQDVEKVYLRMKRLTLGEIADEFSAASSEPRNAFAALLLARALLIAFEVPALPVSPWGLRHGILFQGPWSPRCEIHLEDK